MYLRYSETETNIAQCTYNCVSTHSVLLYCAFVQILYVQYIGLTKRTNNTA